MGQMNLSLDDFLNGVATQDSNRSGSAQEPRNRHSAAQQSLSSPWGRFELPKGRTDRWLIRNLELIISHTDQHWIVRNRHVLRNSADADHATRRLGLTESELNQELKFDRIAQPVCSIYAAQFQTLVVPALAEEQSGESLLFSPLLPELPVLIKLTDPIVLDADESTFLVGQLPLEIRIDLVSARAQASRELSEVRIEPLSEAWSTNSPHEGELCLSLYRPFSIPLSVHQGPPQRPTDLGFGARSLATSAKVKVSVVNPTPFTQILNQFLIPSSDLNLYHCSEQGFWSSDLILTPTANSSTSAQVGVWSPEVTRALPQLAESPRLTTPARRDRPEGERSKKSTGTIASLSGRLASLFKEKA